MNIVANWSYPTAVKLGRGRIKELAEAIAKIVGYEGTIAWDREKPDGAPRKLLDSTRMKATCWRPTIDLDSGLRDTYRWFKTASTSAKH